MTDITKYRNVSLTHEKAKKLNGKIKKIQSS